MAFPDFDATEDRCDDVLGGVRWEAGDIRQSSSRGAIALVKQRGVSVRQAARDLGLHPNLLHRWINTQQDDGPEAFPGPGRMRPDDAEVARLKRELAKTKAERDILKKAIAYFAKDPQ